MSCWNRTSFAEDLQQRLEQVHEFARSQLKITSDRMKRYYDAHLEGQRLEAGDPVWLHNPQRKKGITPKLMRPWQGPYVVTKRINDLVYRIQLGPRTKPRVVHRNRLWKYSGHNPPSWFQLESLTSVEQDSSDSGPAAPNQSNGPLHTKNNSDGSLPRRSGRSRNPPNRYGT